MSCWRLHLLLLANLFYYQVFKADALANDNRNARTIIKEYSIERGRMVVGTGDDEVVVAESVRTDDALEYLRKYPEGRKYAFITGFYSFVFGRDLAEQVFNDFLIGKAPEQFAQNLEQLLTAEDQPGGTLQLTIDPRVQSAAIEGWASARAPWSRSIRRPGRCWPRPRSPATTRTRCPATTASRSPGPGTSWRTTRTSRG